jgi:hypothetical protein
VEILKRPKLSRRAWLALILTGTAGLLPPLRAADTPTEYELKAALLYNFTQFVSWPDKAFASPDAPLVIGVLGRDPFGDNLDRIVQGEKSGSHPLVVERCDDLEAARHCHVLFVSASERDDLARIFTSLRGRPVLTVGDCDGFVRRGGMVMLYMTGKRIRLRVDREAAQAADLTLSAKLLRVVELSHAAD